MASILAFLQGALSVLRIRKQRRRLASCQSSCPASTAELRSPRTFGGLGGSSMRRATCRGSASTPAPLGGLARFGEVARAARNRPERIGGYVPHRPSSGAAREGSTNGVAVAVASVDARCGECGDVLSLSRRRAYEHRRSGTTPRCDLCGRPQTKLTPAKREPKNLDRPGARPGQQEEDAPRVGRLPE
jgi:hypothetical protein